MYLLILIVHTLGKADWTLIDWADTGLAFTMFGKLIGNTAFVGDVAIGFDLPMLSPGDEAPAQVHVAKALMDALVAEHITATANPMGGPAPNAATASVIHINIGRKM